MVLCDVNNTAHWIGLHEANDDRNLIQYLGVYLIFIAAALVSSTVSYYQVRKRYFLIRKKLNIVEKKTVQRFYSTGYCRASLLPGQRFYLME